MVDNYWRITRLNQAQLYDMLLTPLITLFSWIAYLYGLEFTVLQLTSSNPIFQIVYILCK